MWHNHCGHLSQLRRTIGAIRGKVPKWDKLKRMDNRRPCIWCLAGKQKQRSYKGQDDPVHYKVGESLHIDNCKMPVLSLGGAKHEFEVEDEASGCLFGVPQAKWKTSGQNLISIVKWLGRQTGNKCLKITCDRVPEFIAEGSKMHQWCTHKQIELSPST